MKVEDIYAISPNKDGWRALKNGTRVKLGNEVKLGDRVELGNWVELGDGVTSNQLNNMFIQSFPDESIFWKWVTPDRMSPNFDGGTPLHYGKGAIIETSDAIASDQQCAPGLHVLRPPYRPEWVGLCNFDHNLICLHVKVCREDICFGGIPTMDAKIRVRKLEVLD